MAHATQVELLVGSTWTDLTAAGDVYTENGITITRGRSSEGGSIDPGTCTLTLKNDGGKFSPRKPTSPYYGLIGRNTPLRVSVRAGSSFLDVPEGGGGRAKVLDTSPIDITGDIDVRVDLTPVGWAGVWNNGAWDVMGKYDANTGQRSWRMLINNNGSLHFGWSTTGSDFTLPFGSTQPVPFQPGQRGAVRATLDVNNGAGGWTLVFYTAPTMAGPWTQLGDPLTAAGVTSIFNSTASLEVGDITQIGFGNPARRYHAIEVRNGIGGTVVANPQFGSQTIGATSFTDSAGRTWLVEGSAALTNKRVRFVGEVSEWPPRWHASGGDQRVTIQASGILRRLNQGAAPLQSTLRRRIPSATGLLAYWPMEEERDATRAYSPVKGVRPMPVTGVDWASDDSLAGSAALPTIQGGGTLNGTVPAPTGPSTAWHGEFVFKCDAGPATVRTLMNWYTSGTVRWWRLMLVGTNAELHGYNDDGVEIISDTTLLAGFGVFGAWTRWQLYATQSGGNIAWTIAFIPIGGTGGQRGGSVAGTVGRITNVTAGAWHQDIAGVRIGHIAAFSTPGTTIYNSADHGFTGETAGARMDRLRTEESLPMSLYGDTTLQVPLGPQRPNTLVESLQAAADADGGVLYEARDGAALRYRDRISQYNQAAKLALVYGAPGLAPPFQPVDDDRNVRNDRTVQRDGGSSARVTLDSGPLSTQAPPNGVGRYDDSVTLSLATDDQCDDQAGWRLWLGTWDEARYPSVHVNLGKAAAASLIDPATAVDLRDRITISNPPESLPPDPISLLVEGYTEVITPTTWDITYVCAPAGPWNVGVVGDGVYGRADTDGSALTASVTSSATALSIITTSGAPEWTTDPAEFPFNVTAGGEVMTATAVSSPANLSDAFNRTNSTTSMGSADTGQAWVPLVNTWGIQTNRAYAVNSANSITSIAAASDLRDLRVTAAVWTTGEVYLLLRMSGANDRVRVGCSFGSPLQLQVISGGSVIRTAVSAVTPVQGDTISVTAQGALITCYINGARVLQVWEETGQLLTLVGLQTANNTVRFDNFAARWTQVMTVTRSVNGVTKAQAAGTDLRLAQPAIAAL